MRLTSGRWLRWLWFADLAHGYNGAERGWWEMSSSVSPQASQVKISPLVILSTTKMPSRIPLHDERHPDDPVLVIGEEIRPNDG